LLFYVRENDLRLQGLTFTIKVGFAQKYILSLWLETEQPGYRTARGSERDKDSR